MNAIRSILSLFLVVVLILSVLGWRWSGGDSTPPGFNRAGARVVLVVAAVAAVGGIGVLWRVNPRNQR